MSELSGLSTSMLLNILRVCTDSRIQRGRELEYVRVVREAVEEALAGARDAYGTELVGWCPVCGCAHRLPRCSWL